MTLFAFQLATGFFGEPTKDGVSRNAFIIIFYLLTDLIKLYLPRTGKTLGTNQEVPELIDEDVIDVTAGPKADCQ